MCWSESGGQLCPVLLFGEVSSSINFSDHKHNLLCGCDLFSMIYTWKQELTLLHLRNTTFHSSMTKGKSVRTFKLGPFQFPDAYLRGYAPRTFSKCFTFACFCKKSKGLLNPLITVHYFFFVCLYVCNRGDTYYSFTASSRQGSLAKPLSLRSLLRSLIVKLLNRQYFPRKTGL